MAAQLAAEAGPEGAPLTAMGKPTISDAKARRAVLLPDGRQGVLTYCPPRPNGAGRRTPAKTSRPGWATVEVDARHERFRPDTLVVLAHPVRKGDRVRLVAADGRSLRARYVAHDANAITVEQLQGGTWQRRQVRRADVARIEVLG